MLDEHPSAVAQVRDLATLVHIMRPRRARLVLAIRRLFFIAASGILAFGVLAFGVDYRSRHDRRRSRINSCGEDFVPLR